MTWFQNLITDPIRIRQMLFAGCSLFSLVSLYSTARGLTVILSIFFLDKVSGFILSLALTIVLLGIAYVLGNGLVRTRVYFPLIASYLLAMSVSFYFNIVFFTGNIDMQRSLGRRYSDLIVVQGVASNYVHAVSDDLDGYDSLSKKISTMIQDEPGRGERGSCPTNTCYGPNYESYQESLKILQMAEVSYTSLSTARTEATTFLKVCGDAYVDFSGLEAAADREDSGANKISACIVDGIKLCRRLAGYSTQMTLSDCPSGEQAHLLERSLDNVGNLWVYLQGVRASAAESVVGNTAQQSTGGGSQLPSDSPVISAEGASEGDLVGRPAAGSLRRDTEVVHDRAVSLGNVISAQKFAFSIPQDASEKIRQGDLKITGIVLCFALMIDLLPLILGLFVLPHLRNNHSSRSGDLGGSGGGRV